eukprot:849209-Pyramimonas_sp.AAC.1
MVLALALRALVSIVPGSEGGRAAPDQSWSIVWDLQQLCIFAQQLHGWRADHVRNGVLAGDFLRKCIQC